MTDKPIIRLTCPHCGGSGRLSYDDGESIEDCGVCCENGYVDQEEYDEYFRDSEEDQVL